MRPSVSRAARAGTAQHVLTAGLWNLAKPVQMDEHLPMRTSAAVQPQNDAMEISERDVEQLLVRAACPGSPVGCHCWSHLRALRGAPPWASLCALASGAACH